MSRDGANSAAKEARGPLRAAWAAARTEERSRATQRNEVSEQRERELRARTRSCIFLAIHQTRHVRSNGALEFESFLSASSILDMCRTAQRPVRIWRRPGHHLGHCFAQEARAQCSQPPHLRGPPVPSPRRRSAKEGRSPLELVLADLDSSRTGAGDERSPSSAGLADWLLVPSKASSAKRGLLLRRAAFWIGRGVGPGLPAVTFYPR